MDISEGMRVCYQRVCCVVVPMVAHGKRHELYCEVYRLSSGQRELHGIDGEGFQADAPLVGGPVDAARGVGVVVGEEETKSTAA